MDLCDFDGYKERKVESVKRVNDLCTLFWVGRLKEGPIQ